MQNIFRRVGERYRKRDVSSICTTEQLTLKDGVFHINYTALSADV